MDLSFSPDDYRTNIRVTATINESLVQELEKAKAAASENWTRVCDESNKVLKITSAAHVAVDVLESTVLPGMEKGDSLRDSLFHVMNMLANALEETKEPRTTA